MVRTNKQKVKYIIAVLICISFCIVIVAYVSYSNYNKTLYFTNVKINQLMKYIIIFACCFAYIFIPLLRYRRLIKYKGLFKKFCPSILGLGKNCWEWIKTNYLTIIITIAFIFVFMHYESKIVEVFFKLINIIIESRFGNNLLWIFVFLLMAPIIYHTTKAIENKTLSDGRTYFFSLMLCCLFFYCSKKYPWEIILEELEIVNPIYGYEWILVFLFNMFGLCSLLIPLALLFVVNNITNQYKENLPSSQEGGYLPDTPITSIDDDILHFQLHIQILKEQIEKIPISGAHSIAITGGWGTGKTSFLYLLQEELTTRSQGQYEVIWFFPMKSSKSENIQNDFFNVLENTLSKYKLGFGRHFNYYKELIGAIDNKYISFLIKLWSIRLEEEKRRINDTLKTIPKRIIIIIDDVDRLKGDEIMQVFRLVGFNANFENIVFLMAFDKSHVKDTLECDANFPDKFFEMEFTLPDNFKNNPIALIKNSIDKFKSKDLDLDWFPTDFLDDESISKHTTYCINSLRDANRFLNSFMGRVNVIHNKLDFVSYYLLSLLHYKEPLLYERIKTTDKEILETNEELGEQHWVFKNDNCSIESDHPLAKILQDLFPKNSKLCDGHFIYQPDSFHDYFNETSVKSYTENKLKDLLSLQSDDKMRQTIEKYDGLLKQNIIDVLNGYKKSGIPKDLFSIGDPERYIINYYRLFYHLKIDDGLNYSEGLAPVKIGENKFAFINYENGKVVFTIECISAKGVSEGLILIHKIIDIHNFNYGFVDIEGNTVIEFIYKNADSFSQGLAPVNKDGWWGFIDKNNYPVIPFKYNGAKRFYKDLAPVNKEGLWGFIDKNDNPVIPFEYDNVDDYYDDCAPVNKNGIWGFEDKEGNFTPGKQSNGG